MCSSTDNTSALECTQGRALHVAPTPPADESQSSRLEHDVEHDHFTRTIEHTPRVHASHLWLRAYDDVGLAKSDSRLSPPPQQETTSVRGRPASAACSSSRTSRRSAICAALSGCERRAATPQAAHHAALRMRLTTLQRTVCMLRRCDGGSVSLDPTASSFWPASSCSG